MPVEYTSSNGKVYFVETLADFSDDPYPTLGGKNNWKYIKYTRDKDNSKPMKIIKNNGEIVEGSYSSGEYCCRQVNKSIVNSQLQSQTISVLQHNCGAIIEHIPAHCSCGIKIAFCKCVKPTQYSGPNSTYICLDCAYDLKYHLCTATGLIGECIQAENLYGGRSFVLKSRTFKCKGENCSTSLTFREYCTSCKDKLYFTCCCGNEIEKSKAKDQSHKKCNNCFIPLVSGPKGFMPSLRTFGLELELNITEVKDDLWKTKLDGSVSGYEFTSPIYSGGEKFHEDIERFCAFVEKKIS